jgi:uncharacterized protein
VLEHVYWVVMPQTAQNGAREVWSQIQALGAPEIGLLPARVQNGLAGPASPGAITKTFAEFLLQLRAERRAAPDPWVAIREIDAAERSVTGDFPGFCEMMGNCIGNIFAVDPDGTIQHCDRFIGDDDYILGHLSEVGFDAARDGPKAAKLKARERDRLESLRACPQFERCQGWCPHVTYSGQPWISGGDHGCCGLRPLLDGIAADA